jgi:hypothetical protein
MTEESSTPDLVEAFRPRFVELRYAVVATWVDGLIQRITSYADIDQARADAERLAQERG